MKKLFSLILTAAMLLSLAACGQSASPEAVEPEPAPEVSEPAEPASHYPVTVVDQAGREVTIEEEPESALDFRFRYQMLKILRNWVQEERRGAIVALHDPNLALNYCDQLLLLSDSKILGSISPAVDSCDTMEQMLEKLCGIVSLHTCCTRSGQTQLVMLKEEEP